MTTKLKPTEIKISQADYTMYQGGWGLNITWFPDGQFDKWNGNEEQTFRVSGHQPVIPKEDQTLLGEFTNSWILFKFVKVEPTGNPSDMFFADVKPIAQELKQ